MMNKQSIEKAYEAAKEIYAQVGIDTDKAIKRANDKPISLHCWQGDDVLGFEGTASLSGGIQTTGNYPGRARNASELRADLDKALSLIPGSNKVALHAIYRESDTPVDRAKVQPEHFTGWADWAVDRKIGLDFNQSLFSHDYNTNGLTISSPDKAVRDYWIEHSINCRKISEYLGKRCGMPSITNFWIPDGTKDIPADRYAPRARLAEAMDIVFKEKIDPKYHKDTIEGKLFGIGSESYVVGSNDFYLAYAAKNGCMLTADVGHYHPTEQVSDKISAYMCFIDEIMLHVSRGVRWDSDHVVLMDNELVSIMSEIVRGGFDDRVNIALDYFDASINRIAAWVTGARNARKAYLRACLEPVEILKKKEQEGDTTAVFVLTEEYKALPWSAVFDYYCLTSGMPVGYTWLDNVKEYEGSVLAARK